MQNIDDVRKRLSNEIATSTTPRDILRSSDLKNLYGQLKNLSADQRGPFGKAVNELKVELENQVLVREGSIDNADVERIDVTAPWDVNGRPIELILTQQGTQHPLTTEVEAVIDIFTRMGFQAIESRQIDDDFHMFGSLNFPENHPARDGYDTFRTEEGLIAPAHTSTMQNRILKDGKAKLEAGGQIAAISYGRVFRNEDVDTTHEHTFHQVEGVFVSKSATLGDRIKENCIDCHMPKRATENMELEGSAGNAFPPLRDHHIRLDLPATETYLNENVTREIGIFNPDIVSNLLQRYFEGSNYLYNRIWIMIMLHKWYLKNF